MEGETPSPGRWPAIERTLRWALIVSAAGFVAVLLSVALLRIRYPFELEWLEGSSLEQVQRLLEGRPLYGPPSPEYVPFMYPPLYYYLAAGAAALMGTGFTALRLVSLCAGVGCLILVFAFVRRETGQALAAWLAAGLFAAAYPLSGTWLDLARIDSLFLMLLLLGAWGARFWPSAAGQALAGLTLAAAFATKQLALLPAAALVAHALLWDRRRARVFVPAVAAGMAGSFLLLDALHGGWYRQYAFASPARHPLVARHLVLFVTRDLLSHFGLAAAGGAAWLILAGAAGRAAPLRFHGSFVLGMLATSAVARANVGGFDNVLMPAHAAIAMLFGMGAHELRRAAVGPERTPLRVLLWLACLLQMAGLAYDPSRWLPSRRDAQAGHALTRRLAALPGPPFLPGHPYLVRRAGWPTHAHHSAINETLRWGPPGLREPLERELARSLRERRYSALMLDSGSWLAGFVEPYYRDAGPVFEDPSLFWPVSGARLRPERLYLPRPEPAPAALPAAP